jgi:hypothetical protein
MKVAEYAMNRTSAMKYMARYTSREDHESLVVM